MGFIVKEVRMQTEVSTLNSGQGQGETQLAAIRELMLAAAIRGEWLTLSEIAGLTEFAEASICAQLRHLRKSRHGRYRVEKRLRRQPSADAEGRGKSCQGAVWEYCVSVPEQQEALRRGCESCDCMARGDGMAPSEGGMDAETCN